MNALPVFGLNCTVNLCLKLIGIKDIDFIKSIVKAAKYKYKQ